MDISVTYDTKREICIVRSVGSITDRDDVRSLFEPVVPLLEKHSGRKVLFDHRNAVIDASIVETFYTAAEPAAWGWKRKYLAAVLYNEITENERFLETVGQNRGIQIKIFDDYDEAVSWLSES